MATPGIKKEAHKLVEELSDNATWEELEYKIYVRKKIDRGLDDIENGDTLSSEEVRQRFGLEPK